MALCPLLEPWARVCRSCVLCPGPGPLECFHVCCAVRLEWAALPALLMPVLFQSNDNEERLQVVKLLAKMFGAKDSELASQNKPLWQCYLGR